MNRKNFRPRRSILYLFAFLISQFGLATVWAQTFNVYFGNLHSHTAYSDGTGTPRQAYDHARLQGRLHFLLISEHNHASAEGTGDDPAGLHIAKDPTLYNGTRPDSLIQTANSINQAFPGAFVALYGQEFSTNSGGNHVNVFEIANVIDEHLVPNKNFRKLYDTWLVTNLDSTGQPAIVQFNHPRSTTQDYGILNYGDMESLLTAASAHVRTIEVINGPHDVTTGGHRIETIKWRAYLTYLNAGFRLAPTADQDNHFITHGTATDHRTAVLAPELTKASILDAIRRSRVYASQDKNLKVWFSVNGQIMGSVIEATPGDALRAEVRLSDEDEPNAAYRVSLRRDTVGGDLEADQELDHRDVVGDATVTFDQFTYGGGKEYFLVQIVQQGDGPVDQVWTAPVWIVPRGTSGDVHPPDEGVVPPTPAPAPTYVWSRNSEVYHLAGCRDADRIAPANRESGATPPAARRLHANCPR